MRVAAGVGCQKVILMKGMILKVACFAEEQAVSDKVGLLQRLLSSSICSHVGDFNKKVCMSGISKSIVCYKGISHLGDFLEKYIVLNRFTVLASSRVCLCLT